MRSAFLNTPLIGLLCCIASFTSLAAAEPLLLIHDDEQAFRSIRVDVQLEPDPRVHAYEFWFADMEFHSLQQAERHSVIQVGDTIDLERTPLISAWESCWSEGLPIHRDEAGFAVISPAVGRFSCLLTGMTPGIAQWIAVVPIDASGIALTPNTGISPVQGITTVSDKRPPPPDTRPVLFALGSIALSVIVLLSWLRWQDARRGRTKSKLAHLYIAPAVIALITLTFYPTAYGFYLAFTNADQSHLGDTSWVGLANFWTVLITPGMLRVTLFTFIWAFSNVICHVLFGLILALALNKPGLRGKTVYRTILLLPWAIPGYISVLAWNGMLQPDGLINGILGTHVEFLSGAWSARILVIMVNIWLGIPFMMASFSGALQALSKDMFEAAEVDGVSQWDQLIHLTLPSLKSTMVPVSLLGFIWSFNSFNTIYLLTRGLPYVGFGEPGATDILITYVFNVAFKYGYYGVAAAWSVIIFIMLMAFSWFYMKKTRATEAMS
jgi:arabinogalactan oligomer/maltooligosaccharide transport system permease protein